MKNLKILLIICVIIIGAADVIIYNFYSQDAGSLDPQTVNPHLFKENLQNASKYEGVWLENINDGVNDKIKKNLYSSSKLKSILPEIKHSLNESQNANANELSYLKNAKNASKTSAETQYVDLLLKKSNTYKKIYEETARMLVNYEKFANRKMSPARLESEMRKSRQKLYEEKATSQDLNAINSEISTLLKANPELKKQLESMNVNPSFLGELYL